MKKPSIEDIQDFAASLDLPDYAEEFWLYYDSVGWKVGKKSMKVWKSAYRGWCNRQAKGKKPERWWPSEPTIKQQSFL